MMPWHAKAKGGKKAKPPPLCGVLKTTPETIEGALEELLDLSREKRDEAELRAILTLGHNVGQVRDRPPPPSPDSYQFRSTCSSVTPVVGALKRAC